MLYAHDGQISSSGAQLPAGLSRARFGFVFFWQSSCMSWSDLGEKWQQGTSALSCTISRGLMNIVAFVYVVFRFVSAFSLFWYEFPHDSHASIWIGGKKTCTNGLFVSLA